MGSHIRYVYRRIYPTFNRSFAQLEKTPPYRIFWIAGIGVTVVLVLLLIAFGLYRNPPSEMMRISRQALSQAREIEAPRYMPNLYREAESNWQKAVAEWKRENQKWFFNRGFKQTIIFTQTAIQQANLAQKRTKEVKDSLAVVLKVKLETLEQRIVLIKADLDRLPIRDAWRKRFAAGELAILESRAAFMRKDYLKADAKLKEGESYIGQAGDKAKENLQNYLTYLPKWRRWAAATIAWSQENSAVAIVIDKMGYECQVYSSGRFIAEYSIELGSNWLGHKLQRGDSSTPEGQYFIHKKKVRGQTKYYKALEINYPNQSDIQAFQRAKRNGSLPATARIGDLIEIHGDGGKGANWTAGCIALSNRDIDRLFDLVNIGTPVTIVGSLNGH